MNGKNSIEFSCETVHRGMKNSGIGGGEARRNLCPAAIPLTAMMGFAMGRVSFDGLLKTRQRLLMLVVL